ncbi:hypothetical protein B0J18DRAFT_469034 [Chaetomium sp. MPI-SDFR-AT-0129]|nr:hypothetical protein B0J18DRAFT_469034 [Chaetomium sp. MPI-SDFR-AT-0129]
MMLSSNQSSAVVTPMPPQVVDGLLRVIAHHLGQTRYALIGGVALNLLGSARATPDIDLLVPSGYAGRVADTLGQTSNFGTERLQSGRSRVWYNAPNRRRYNVDIMEPGDIHQQFPSSDGGIITVRSARLLRPALLLNYKCFAWQVREDPRKKLSDAQDILFLLRYMVASGIQTSSQEVNHATPDFFVEFLASYPDAEELFVAIGLQCR